MTEIRTDNQQYADLVDMVDRRLRSLPNEAPIFPEDEPYWRLGVSRPQREPFWAWPDARRARRGVLPTPSQAIEEREYDVRPLIWLFNAAQHGLDPVPALTAAREDPVNFALGWVGSVGRPHVSKTLAHHFTQNQFKKFNLSKSRGWNLFDSIGVHVGSKKAARDRFRDMGGFKGQTKTVEVQLRKPLLNSKGEVFSEQELRDWLESQVIRKKYKGQMSGDPLHGRWVEGARPGVMKPVDKEAVSFIREQLIREGFDVIPYINKIEDPGNISFIVLNPQKLRTVSPSAKGISVDMPPIFEQTKAGFSPMTRSEEMAIKARFLTETPGHPKIVYDIIKRWGAKSPD